MDCLMMTMMDASSCKIKIKKYPDHGLLLFTGVSKVDRPGRLSAFRKSQTDERPGKGFGNFEVG